MWAFETSRVVRSILYLAGPGPPSPPLTNTQKRGKAKLLEEFICCDLVIAYVVAAEFLSIVGIINPFWDCVVLRCWLYTLYII